MLALKAANNPTFNNLIADIKEESLNSIKDRIIRTVERKPLKADALNANSVNNKKQPQRLHFSSKKTF